jgi:hypothetical protein
MRKTILLSVTAILLACVFTTNFTFLRVSANNTPQTLPFSQNWTANLITANDDWSPVPGIEGFLGQDITTATGVDPQTLLTTSTAANDLDVIANQANPNTLTSGGVAEFDGIPNPTIALQGSGTADAPHVIIYLNTTGQNNIRVSYNIRDIDGSADNAVQQVALQYRVGNAGNFINLPQGYVADATTGPNEATLVTPIAVTLPAAANNQPLVQVRIITTNAPGSDEWVGIDDISVTSAATAAPNRANVDFNGDGRSDWVVGRNVNGQLTWYIQNNGTAGSSVTPFGLPTDRAVPEDYDGDGKDDIAVWRESGNPVPNRSYFFILRSTNNTLQVEQFGGVGDNPAIVGDYDGDGKADVAVFRQSDAVNMACGPNQSIWFYRPSGTAGVDFRYDCWGRAGDFPAPGDFDGDGKNDYAVQRNEGGNAIFFLKNSGGTTEAVFFGQGTDVYIPGDYDGDGKSDIAVRRTVSGAYHHFILTRTGGGTGAAPIVWGLTGDISTPGDYDGDGRTDIAVFRPNADAYFFVRQSSNSSLVAFKWGQDGDIAPASFQVR